MDDRSPGAAAEGALRIGAYSLEVGRLGSFARFEAEAERANARELAAALEQEPDDRPPVIAAVEDFQESADAVTGRIEQADKLLRDAVSGKLLEIGNISGEVDALLDLCARLDSEGRFDEELRLMRSLNGLLALSLRWLDLIRSLWSLLRSSEAAGHEAAQAFAHHELGSLNLCAGRAKHAVEHLERASQLERGIGDLAGSCATRHNLDSARRDLASRRGWFRRPRQVQRLVILAGALAIAGGSGAGIALAIHGNDGNRDTTVPPPPSSHVVSVQLRGKGTGSVRGPGIACPKDCRAVLRDGRAITLTATPADGSVFTRWSQDACGRATRCNLTVIAALAVTATFARASDKQRPTTPTGLDAKAVSSSEIDLSWTESSDNVAVTGYVIYRDQLKLTTVSGTTRTYRDTGLAPSTDYLYTVQAVDAAGNASFQSRPAKERTPAPADEVAPSTPADFTATANGSTEIDLTWTSSTDNVAVTGYVITRGGVELATVAATDTSYHDTGLDPSRGYVYTIEAIDAAGNHSPQAKTKESTGSS